MNDQARGDYERNLATAIFALWTLFAPQTKSRRMPDYNQFRMGFNAEVKPIITTVYGNSRQDLAAKFGMAYPQRPGEGGSIVSMPRLNGSIELYTRELYDLFGKRASAPTAVEPNSPDLFSTYDALRIAVTTVTAAKSHGEFDAADDVRSRMGRQLVCVWKCELGACKKICQPLDGKPWGVWRMLFRDGPPAHPNCACDLVWRWLLV